MTRTLRIEELLRRAISDGAFPGAAWAVVDAGGMEAGYEGRHRYSDDSPEITRSTIWDLASVSKVVGTTSAAMMLVEDGLFDLDEPVSTVLPEFGKNGKEGITFINLLVHNSGLVAFRRYHEFCHSPAEIHAAIDSEGLTYPTGSQTVYSDLSMIVVARAIERLTQKPLEEFLRERLFGPLGIRDTGFNPADADRCAPTERTELWRRDWGGNGREFIQGEVHDPTAFALGGVAGHAGLFATLPDLVQFMKAFTRDEIVTSQTRERFTSRYAQGSSRALGWDTKSENSSAGTLFGTRSFGHTGYTGTSVWCDPDAERFAILLTNRVHPTSENLKIAQVRPKFHDLAAGTGNEN